MGIWGASALLLACLAGAPAQAQSAYGCRGLETDAAMAAVEGKDGVFFRLLPDLQSHRAMEGQTIDQIGALSKALKERGTTLVLLPVPGRAQVLASKLPAGIAFSGYDPDTAHAVHDDMFKRLDALGVTVADPRAALAQAALTGEALFLGTDPRPTVQGSRIMAQVVAKALAANPDAKDLPRAGFTTQQTGDSTALGSAMHAKLQAACQDALPPLEVSGHVTTGDDAAQVNAAGVVAIIGTGMTGTPALNFAGFVSEYSGLRAGAYGVNEGGAYAGMSSYLTSLDFAQTPPQVLVWEMPVWSPFGMQGDQPMAELLAAATQNCPVSLALTGGADAQSRSADLSGIAEQDRVTLALDTDGVAALNVRFDFTSADGQVRSRAIYRNPDQILTGRFYLPLSGLEQTELRKVEVVLDQGFGPAPKLSLCPQEVTP